MNYHASPYFNFGVGRFHTSIGYYNTAFHQGEWFQTAIGRPFMYQFDDTGGPLPLQEVGVSTSGILPSGKLGLHYVVEAGNGRAHLLGSNPAQNKFRYQQWQVFQYGDVCAAELDTRLADRILALSRLCDVLRQYQSQRADLDRARGVHQFEL